MRKQPLVSPITSSLGSKLVLATGSRAIRLTERVVSGQSPATDHDPPSDGMMNA